MKNPILRSILLILFCSVFMGCQYFGDSLGSVYALDQAGKNAEAIKAYQKYLEKHPTVTEASFFYYRIAKNFEALADHARAVQTYEFILETYPNSDEAVHSLLDLAVIYRDKLMDPKKALEYDQRAFSTYMDNDQLRAAVQPLINTDYQKVLETFTKKDYKKAGDEAEALFQLYPATLFSPETHDKVKALASRAHRAQAMAEASVDLINLTSETAFGKSDEVDFISAKDERTNSLFSPDGKMLVRRKSNDDGVHALYLAKAPKEGKKARYKLVKGTSGAGLPCWSPDSKTLLFCRVKKKVRSLQKLDIKNMNNQSLFSAKKDSLGASVVFHPSGNKIVFVYGGQICLMDIGRAGFKHLLKPKVELHYNAILQWSIDGTLLRCKQSEKHGKDLDELLTLDVSASNNL